MSEPTTIIVPSTPTPGVASIPSFSGTISPKAFSVEARLDLSLGTKALFIGNHAALDLHH